MGVEKPIYVIVHEWAVVDELSNSPFNITRVEEVWDELQRILEKEECRKVNWGPSDIPEDLPLDRQVKLCGAFVEICVDSQLRALKRNGYNVELYGPAALSFYDVVKKS